MRTNCMYLSLWPFSYLQIHGLLCTSVFWVTVWCYLSTAVKKIKVENNILKNVLSNNGSLAKTITETAELCCSGKRKQPFCLLQGIRTPADSCLMLIYGPTVYKAAETGFTSSSYNSNMLLTH